MKLTLEDLNFINHHIHMLNCRYANGIEEALYRDGILYLELPSQFETLSVSRDEVPKLKESAIYRSKIYLDENFEVVIDLQKEYS